MEQIKYRVVSAPLLRVLQRNDSSLIKIRVKNTGNVAWFDIGKKKVAEHVVLDIVNKAKLLDFKIKWGKDGEKTDRKFSHVADEAGRPDSNQHVTKPGQTATFHVQITAKKYATSGIHRIEFAPTIFEYDKHESFGGGRSVWLYVRGKKYCWFHLKRTLKLLFIKLGKVDRVFNNQAYANIRDTRGSLPVVMATWQRIQSLPRTIEALSNQKSAKPVLFLWNNNKKARKKIDEIIKNSNLPISVRHSSNNIGGFGRFYLARELADHYDKVIFIDDDQFPEEDYLNNLTKEFESKTIKSQWAFSFPNSKNYWHKQLVDKGQEADYCGTGGMIVDTSIFKEKEVFKCPKRYWFVEDLWLSFIAKHRYNWRLMRSITDLEIQEDGKDQFVKMIELKTHFLMYLMGKYR